MHIHYALQTCDTAFNQFSERYCNTDKATVVRKCVTSFFASVKLAAEQDPSVQHTICIFDDHSTESTVTYLRRLLNVYSAHNVRCSFHALEERGGIMASIRATYEWLRDHGIDLVYQVQDDYLFHPNAVGEMIDLYNQLWRECDTQAIISSWNCSRFWRTIYRYWASPRTVVAGKNRYWIQLYDTSCSFLTHLDQLKKHWDLIELFLSLPPKGLPDGSLEAVSLNYMFTKRGVLGMMPVDSLALHIQSEEDKDPHIDWKQWWDQVQEVEI